MNRKQMTLVAGLCLTTTLAACGGQRAFTRGTYEDPNVIQMLSDDFNENDLQLIAKKMVNSMSASPFIQNVQGNPLLMMGRIENNTSEHIDTEALVDKVRVHLIQLGRFAFVNNKARQEIAEEYDYQNSGYVNEETAKGPGQQASPDFILTGRVTSIIQEVGADKLVYYKFTMEMTDIRSGVIVWADEKELRKQFEKQSVGW